MLDVNLDPAVLKALPINCEVVAVSQHGTASWSLGYKIDVEVDGKEKKYFLKIIEQSHHAEMVLGEYESQKILGYYLPDNVSIALAYGTLEQDTSQSFLLTPFRDMEDITPNPTQLVEVLERLHTSSVSENGKFGFHVATFNGHVPLVNDWTNTWEEWYSRQLQSDIHWLDGCIGKDADFNRVVAEFVDKVVPRLLRPLQTGGRNIKPTLVHGDIWHGNAQIDMATQKVILFDSCCCYAHNELELHMMREPRYRFAGDYIIKYKATIQPSDPVEDFDDRNALYAMRDNIINAGLHKHFTYLRQNVKEEMLRLLAKHPYGYHGFCESFTNISLRQL